MVLLFTLRAGKRLRTSEISLISIFFCSYLSEKFKKEQKNEHKKDRDIRQIKVLFRARLPYPSSLLYSQNRKVKIQKKNAVIQKTQPQFTQRSAFNGCQCSDFYTQEISHHHLIRKSRYLWSITFDSSLFLFQ